MSALRESVRRHRHELWVDNLRVVLIAGVIVVHTATAYVVDIPWYYDDERAASGLWAMVIGLPTLLAGAFGLGPLFLVAGVFSARSVARRGPVGFTLSRLVRLGVPLLVFVLLIQPMTDWIGNRRSERGSFLHYLGITEVSVMWFVAALLVFSLGYAGLRHLRPLPTVTPSDPPPPAADRRGHDDRGDISRGTGTAPSWARRAVPPTRRTSCTRWCSPP